MREDSMEMLEAYASSSPVGEKHVEGRMFGSPRTSTVLSPVDVHNLRHLVPPSILRDPNKPMELHERPFFVKGRTSVCNKLGSWVTHKRGSLEFGGAHDPPEKQPLGSQRNDFVGNAKFLPWEDESGKFSVTGVGLSPSSTLQSLNGVQGQGTQPQNFGRRGLGGLMDGTTSQTRDQYARMMGARVPEKRARNQRKDSGPLHNSWHHLVSVESPEPTITSTYNDNGTISPQHSNAGISNASMTKSPVSSPQTPGNGIRRPSLRDQLTARSAAGGDERPMTSSLSKYVMQRQAGKHTSTSPTSPMSPQSGQMSFSPTSAQMSPDMAGQGGQGHKIALYEAPRATSVMGIEGELSAEDWGEEKDMAVSTFLRDPRVKLISRFGGGYRKARQDSAPPKRRVLDAEGNETAYVWNEPSQKFMAALMSKPHGLLREDVATRPLAFWEHTHEDSRPTSPDHWKVESEELFNARERAYKDSGIHREEIVKQNARTKVNVVTWQDSVKNVYSPARKTKEAMHKLANIKKDEMSMILSGERPKTHMESSRRKATIATPAWMGSAIDMSNFNKFADTLDYENSRLVNLSKTRAQQVQVRSQLVLIKHKKEMLETKAQEKREDGHLETAAMIDLEIAEVNHQEKMVQDAMALIDEQSRLLIEASKASRPVTEHGVLPIGMLESDFKRILTGLSKPELIWVIQTAKTRNSIFGDEKLSTLKHWELSMIVATDPMARANFLNWLEKNPDKRAPPVAAGWATELDAGGKVVKRIIMKQNEQARKKAKQVEEDAARRPVTGAARTTRGDDGVRDIADTYIARKLAMRNYRPKSKGFDIADYWRTGKKPEVVTVGDCQNSCFPKQKDAKVIEPKVNCVAAKIRDRSRVKPRPITSEFSLPW